MKTIEQSIKKKQSALTETQIDDTMGAHIGRKEAPPMSNKDCVKRYHEKLDEFKIRPYADEGQTIREYAATHEMSVQGLFLEAVREYMKNHPEAGTEKGE